MEPVPRKTTICATCSSAWCCGGCLCCPTEKPSLSWQDAQDMLAELFEDPHE